MFYCFCFVLVYSCGLSDNISLIFLMFKIQNAHKYMNFFNHLFSFFICGIHILNEQEILHLLKNDVNEFDIVQH